jgi:hypothetical protein
MHACTSPTTSRVSACTHMSWKFLTLPNPSAVHLTARRGGGPRVTYDDFIGLPKTRHFVGVGAGLPLQCENDLVGKIRQLASATFDDLLVPIAQKKKQRCMGRIRNHHVTSRCCVNSTRENGSKECLFKSEEGQDQIRNRDTPLKAELGGRVGPPPFLSASRCNPTTDFYQPTMLDQTTCATPWCGNLDLGYDGSASAWPLSHGTEAAIASGRLEALACDGACKTRMLPS